MDPEVFVSNPDSDFAPPPQMIFSDRAATITQPYQFTSSVTLVGPVLLQSFSVGEEETDVMATYRADFVISNLSWRFYRQRSAGGPANDYQRLAFNWASDRITIATEAAGAGTGSPDIDLNPTGTLRLGWENTLRMNGTGGNWLPEVNQGVSLGNETFAWNNIVSVAYGVFGGDILWSHGTGDDTGIINSTRQTAFKASDAKWSIYPTDSGGSYPFDAANHTIIQPPSTLDRDLLFVAGSPAEIVARVEAATRTFGAYTFQAFDDTLAAGITILGKGQQSAPVPATNPHVYTSVAGGPYPFTATGHTVLQTITNMDFVVVNGAGVALMAVTPSATVFFGDGLWSANDGSTIGFAAPTSPGANQTYKLPSVDGSAGWSLTTDGAGNLSFVNVTAGVDAVTLNGQPGSFYQDAGNLNAGVLLDARVQESNVTQHQAALVLDAAQVTTGIFPVARGGTGLLSVAAGQYVRGNGNSPMSVLLPSVVRADIGADDAANLITGVLADARVQESNVTQYTNKLVMFTPVSVANVSQNLTGSASTNWTSLDLGVNVPAGSVAALLYINPTQVGGGILEFRKKNTTNQPVAWLTTAGTIAMAGEVIVEVDASGDIEYRIRNANATTQTVGGQIFVAGRYE